MHLDELDVILIIIGIPGIIYTIYGVRKEMQKRRGGSGQTPTSVFRQDDNSHKIYTTIDGPFGTKIHVDENGNYAGQSMSRLFGDTIHVDADGNYAGASSPGLFDGQTIHTDADGNYAGQSNRGLFGTTVHSGKNGETGVTSDGLFGSKVTDIDYHDDWQ